MSLFAEDGLSLVFGQGSGRAENIAGRPHGPGDDDGAIAVVDDLACEAGGGCRQLGATLFKSFVQFQSQPVAAEAVGQDDVGSGFDEAAMNGQHLFRLLEIPALRCLSGLQPESEHAGAHGAVGQEPRAIAEQLFERGLHMPLTVTASGFFFTGGQFKGGANLRPFPPLRLFLGKIREELSPIAVAEFA